MKLYLYSLKNRLSGQFERPVAEVYEPKVYPEYLGQSLALAEVEVLTRYKEYDVYCLGILDTKTGHITSNVDFLETLEGMCLSYIAAKSKETSEHERKDA